MPSNCTTWFSNKSAIQLTNVSWSFKANQNIRSISISYISLKASQNNWITQALSVSTSFSGSLFSASLSRWKRDPGCGWSRDHLSIQNRRVGGYICLCKFVTVTIKETLLPHPSSRFFYHPDSGWSRDQPQPGSLFQRLREAEKRDPGNEVVSVFAQLFKSSLNQKCNFQICGLKIRHECSLQLTFW